MIFYIKQQGRRVSVRWHPTYNSLIHASTDGSRAVCGDAARLLPPRNDRLLAKNTLACGDCQELVFRAAKRSA